MQARNSRIGLILFFVYLLLYGGFVLANTFWPKTMEATPLAENPGNASEGQSPAE